MEKTEWTIVKSKKSKSKLLIDKSTDITLQASRRRNSSDIILQLCDTKAELTYSEIVNISHHIVKTSVFDKTIHMINQIIQPESESYSNSNDVKCNISLDIIALGIGSLSKSLTSKLQIALLIAVRNLLKSSYQINTVKAYDPMMTLTDHAICKRFDIDLIDENKKGKLASKSEVYRFTCFYMPHCPYRLYNNVLFANWDNLSNIIIIGNRLDVLSQYNDSDMISIYLSLHISIS